MNEKYILVLCTINDSTAAKNLAHHLIKEQLVACVNILPQISSVYLWKNEIIEEEECLLVMKTLNAGYSTLEKRIQELHPYEVPEILSIDIQQGLPDYLQWLKDSIRL